MAAVRKPLQGVKNIIRFNWHFYVIAFTLTILSAYILSYFPEVTLRELAVSFISLGLTSIILSLVVSLYVYDLSGIYTLDWLEKRNSDKMLINIHSGFDETSELLQQKYTEAKLIVFDFYDPAKHTEVSIKRARKAYPAYKGTQQISTLHLPLENDSADKIFLILAAHEIRNENERIIFFNELKRVVKPDGQIIVTEHLRDLPNFIAYTIGFLHFHSKSTWDKTFRGSGLEIQSEKKITPFISTFVLTKNGTSI